MNLLTNYIVKLPVEESLKQKLLAPAIIRAHGFYVNLVPYLAPAFPKVSSESLEKLCGSAYLYFKTLIYLDQIMDRNDTVKEDAGSKLLGTFMLFEKSVQDLAGLFSAESEFWTKFEEFKQQYFNTVFVEKQLSVTRENIDSDMFIKIAEGKSAVCYAIVSALGTLNGSNSSEDELVSCLKHIHVAFQYLDDIDDFNSDIKTGQWTYPQVLVSNYLRSRQINSDVESDRTFYKYLFISGIANELLEQAEVHYSKALKISTDLSLKELSKYLTSQMEQCRKKRYEIDLMIEKARLKASQLKTVV